MLNLLTAASNVVAPVPATGLATQAWLMIAIPLASFTFLILAGRATDKWGHWVSCAATATSMVLGLGMIIQALGLPADQRVQNIDLFTWIPAGEHSINFGLRIDPLSLTFVGLVTFVGFLIHVYAIAYMEHDKDRRRFFAYLNLFIAAMLTLVLGNSFAVLFVGWEGVGLASYLLIGFWNYRLDYAKAAKKAFVMNRVGDVGLLLGMMAIFAAFGTLDYTRVFSSLDSITTNQATMIGLFLLLAACGKSAQFPLQAWLGDAMAGPTPVSALIHAATMVTAGVYLMVRTGGIYVMTPVATTFVAIIGAITLLFGAIVGCAKDDIKKVLAASTMSQIGYMMLGAGLGPIGWAFAIFHLLTHGFFKAQMFLGAGSVMHAMGDQTNMRRFGALKGAMKITWITFGIGWLAILGIPPFSGFWSKDKIIEAAFVADTAGAWQPWVLGFVALIGAGITAFYMSRLFFMTFHGEARWTTEAEGEPVHPHESPALMTVPMIILSVFSVALGGVLAINGAFVTWLEPVTGHAEHGEPVLPATVIMVLTLAAIAVGVVYAWYLYVKQPVNKAVPAGNGLVHAARNDMYQDQINDTLFVKTTEAAATGVNFADRHLVDGAVRGISALVRGLGSFTAPTQNGHMRSYASYTLLGAIALLATALIGLL
ncbi:NADH-quinone oxidoreductase subunit L [Boudabousia liubingyangii]|uniref:NADH-quinone oxidoreductase subunit L n=1 Tax=Boudabousia liubingyangii TaxID=1921764 RepID=A0A1Q5PQ46_9ACTO|nr:NADH-quinone oxidoreductase subunit L [Boudabousia liubingyangii]OKL48290.1 NADH-quinone oxidoreductase subunit L [Boudabousia liubingyangii]OKL49674.1 NADH-quinone oxidoreductase subunit L [Boudabousia liubingyangii]